MTEKLINDINTPSKNTKIKLAKTRLKKYSLINIFLFAFILTLFGTLLPLIPNSKISLEEKRALAQFPEFSIDSVLNGSYMNKIDNFIQDNFPFRQIWINLSNTIIKYRGIQNKQIAFYDAKTIAPKNVIVMDHNDTTVVEIDSSTSSKTVIGGGDIVSNILIYNGMAIQIFGGNNAMANAYAKVINKYQNIFNGSINIFDIVVPSHASFYLPEQYKKMSVSEKNNIDHIYSSLSPGIYAVDAYTEMEAHKNEYLFFRTDHHWTGRGAYYAYYAFCKKAGIPPIELGSMERKIKKKFLGSLYWLTRDSRLAENYDSVEYFKVPGKFKAWYYTDSLINKGRLITVYAEYASNYGVFLGGDFPLMKIETSLSNGKRVLLLKNSYGNAFAPYLTANFERVYVIDYRYFNHDVKEFVSKEGITDIVILNGTFSANTSWHLYRLGKILGRQSTVNLITNKKDSTKAKMSSDSITYKIIPDSIK